MKQGKANTSPVTNTLQLIPDVPAPEPFGVGDGEAETVLLNGSVVAAPPSVPEREKKYYVIIFQEILFCYPCLSQKLNYIVCVSPGFIIKTIPVLYFFLNLNSEPDGYQSIRLALRE